MKLIDRYVGRQVLTTALFAVAVLSFVLVLGNIFRKIFELLINHEVPIEFILTFIGYVVPFSLIFTVPWGFLTAILLVFGKLSAESELTAFRANGVPIQRICYSVAALAILFSLLCLWLNVDVAPKAQDRMKATLFHIATSNPIALFESDQVIEEFPGRKIYVGKKNGNDLQNVLVFELNERNVPMRVVHAQRGRIEVADDAPAASANATATGSNSTTVLGNSTVESGEKRIQLRLFDARFEQRDENDPGDLRRITHGITMTEGVLSISLKELYEKNRKRKGFSSMTLSELRSSLDQKQTAAVATAARTEVSKRFSFSLACIAFALVGVPLGITAQRRETSIGFGISLVIGMAYFLFIPVADAFRDNPAAHPEFLIWLPNVIFISLGIYLFSRLARR